MSQSTITYLADDFDGSDAEETIRFSLDGKSYEIDLNKKNASALRRDFKPYIEAGRSSRRASSGSRKGGGTVTAFSKLSDEQKTAFRKWAKLPTARRIADAKVQAWIKSGRP